jgi:hypothetical protein
MALLPWSAYSAWASGGGHPGGLGHLDAHLLQLPAAAGHNLDRVTGAAGGAAAICSRLQGRWSGRDLVSFV